MAENNKENFATTPIRKFTFSIQFLGTGENKRPATTEEVVAIMREYEDKGIIKKWAVMNHNKDVYDEEEEQEGYILFNGVDYDYSKGTLEFQVSSNDGSGDVIDDIKIEFKR